MLLQTTYSSRRRRCIQGARTEVPPVGGDQGFDRLLDRDAKREAAIYLEDWLARYEEAGDWTSQITILNEMMGFYRNSREREKGLAAVERGWPWWEIMGFPRPSPAAPPVSMPPLP